VREFSASHRAIPGEISYNVNTILGIANAFKLAGDILIDRVLASDIKAYEIVYPVLYNYRHCLELYLKAVLKGIKGHQLLEMMEKLEEQIQKELNAKLPAWFRKWILEFDEFNRRSNILTNTLSLDTLKIWVNPGLTLSDLEDYGFLCQEVFH